MCNQRNADVLQRDVDDRHIELNDDKTESGSHQPEPRRPFHCARHVIGRLQKHMCRGAAPGVPENFPGVRALEAQVTQTWVVIGPAPERPVIFALCFHNGQVVDGRKP